MFGSGDIIDEYKEEVKKLKEVIKLLLKRRSKKNVLLAKELLKK